MCRFLEHLVIYRSLAPASIYLCRSRLPAEKQIMIEIASHSHAVSSSSLLRFEMLLMVGSMKAGVERPQQQQSEKKQRGRPPLRARAAALLCAACFFLGALFSRGVDFLPSDHRARAASSSCERNIANSAQDCERNRFVSMRALSIHPSQGPWTSSSHRWRRNWQQRGRRASEEARRRHSSSSESTPLSAARSGGNRFEQHGCREVVETRLLFSLSSFRCSADEEYRSVPSPGSKLRRLEEEKGVVMRFVIGRSATPGGALDRAIDEEDAETKDFLRLEHLEGYHELSAKTKVFFATAVATWDADFYAKVDDDVHVNLGQLSPYL
ncbi:hypothetical protein B296_00043767 [Ensete ventricosum]|uniref:Hexosyltransferase n=1 Tax=Ensete ventricosum TaxID=4639 RepID=A0A426XR61_ENSVE|nr:hypothetical protein B296_00043767 [Ensete ventricosum]